MAMDTRKRGVALIAGGHTFGKVTVPPIRSSTSGPNRRCDDRRAGTGLEEQLRERQRRRRRSPADSKARGRRPPVKWSNNYFDNLFNYEWELTKSPAGANQWKPRCRRRRYGPRRARSVEATRADDAHHRSRPSHGPAVRSDFEAFHEHPDQLADAFARAWYKLTHRDMDRVRATSARSSLRKNCCGKTRCRRDAPAGRRRRHLGAQRQDSCIRPPDFAIGRDGLGRPQRPSATPTSAAVRTGRACVSHRKKVGRSTSPRSCGNGARDAPSGFQTEFNAAQTGGKRVSLADLIVSRGCAAVEKAAKKRGP